MLPPEGGACPNCAASGDDKRLDEATVALSIGQSDTIAESAAPVSGLKRVGHYRIVRQLGAGGMGTVYLAHDENMDRDVALKVMSRHQGGSDKATRRFEQEAWIAGRLDHPNIVRVYERGVWEDLNYFSMEVVSGGSLADVVDNMRRLGRDDALALKFGSSEYVHWAMRKIIEAARGLEHAHRQGVVHRDVKPLNLLLSKARGELKIADFGLAIDAEVTRMTTAGAVLGTIMFMAPEQIRGEGDAIDARTDVYALGVTLFELLTLKLPYSGKTQQMYMSQVLSSEARRASALNAMVGRDLEVVLSKAMEKEQKERYQSAAAFADDLDNVLHLRPIEARPVGRVTRLLKWIRRKPVHAALIGTLVVTIPIGSVVAIQTVQEHFAARAQRIRGLLDEARWAEERERPQMALDRVARVLDLDGDNVDAMRHRAMAHYMLWNASGVGEARDAEHAQRMLTDIGGVVAARPEASWPLTLRAFMLHQLGRSDEALLDEAAAQRLRADPPTDEDLSEEARLAHIRGESARAVELFSELIGRYPDSVQALASRALALENVGRADEALIDYRVVIGIDPQFARAYVDLASLSADRGKIAEALGFIERALEFDAEDPLAQEALAHVKLTEGRQAIGEGRPALAILEQAEQAARKALALNPDSRWTRLNLATSLLEQHRLLEKPDPALMQRVVDEFRATLEDWKAPPDSGLERVQYMSALINCCDAEIQLGRLEEALAICSRVTVAFPDEAIGYYNLAGVFALLGRADEALAALRRDLELGDRDWQWLAGDGWFEALHDDERFRRIVAEMKQLAQADS